MLTVKVWEELHIIGLERMNCFAGYNVQQQKNENVYQLAIKKQQVKGKEKEKSECEKRHVEVHLLRACTQAHWAKLRGLRYFEKLETKILTRLCSSTRCNMTVEHLRNNAPSFKVDSDSAYLEAMERQLPIAHAYVDHFLVAEGLPLQKLNWEKKRRVRT